MRVLAAPSSLKGVLRAADAAAALAEGLRAGGAEAVELPVADGGEGTADALHRSLGGDWHEAEVADPFGRAVQARWLLLPDRTAVVEAAAAIGLPLLAADELDPLRASSRGLGELIAVALAAHPTALLVCLGGVATVDGGAGLREVLEELAVPTRAACDVRTKLGDAARLYGPQKGAAPEQVAELEERLASLPELRPYATLPGSGAAGGLGAALAALGAELVRGAGLVLDLVGFERQALASDLVVTGEGAVDATTAEGKAPGEVVARCNELGVPVALFGGLLVHELPGAELHELSGDPDPIRAREDLVELGRRLAS